MAENSYRVKLSGVPFISEDGSGGVRVYSGCSAYITAYNTTARTADADGVLPLCAAVGGARNMTLENNSVKVGGEGVYSVSFSVRLNPGSNASVALCRNGEILDGTILSAACGVNSFSYSGVFALGAGDVMTLITDCPRASLAGDTSVVLSLFRIAQ